MNAYGVKAGWIIPVVDKRVGGLTRAIPERIRGGYDDALYKSTFTLLTHYTLVSHGEYAVGYTDGRTDGRTKDRYITLSARRGHR